MQVNISTVPTVFNFAADLTLRVFDAEGNPWFATADIEKMFGITNIRARVAKLEDDEKSTIPAPHGGHPLSIVNESGLWTLVLRSDAALKKGTAAYKARKWVTSEVLPTIRKTGSYGAAPTITPAQQHAVRNAIGRRAKAVSVHYQTIYHALYDRFQIPRYTELLSSDFDEAIEFIKTCEIRPQLEADAPAQALPEGATVFLKNEIDLMLDIVFSIKYMNRVELAQIWKSLHAVGSPMAPKIWELANNPSVYLLEKALNKKGYSVTDRESYKYLCA